MQSRRVFLSAAAACLVTGCSSSGRSTLPYQNEKLPTEKRIDDLLGRMTAQEKLDLFRSATRREARGNSRLGIPAIRTAEGHFSGIALAATWNPDLATREGQLVGQEALAHGTDQIIGPTVQDFGEDPWLASRMTVACISGLQGEGVIGTVRRFPARIGGSDERTMQERQLPAFEAAVEEAGVWSVMATSDDPHLLTDVLRQQWGFKGFVVYDSGAKAGTPDTIDEGVRPILRAMFASGLFDRKPVAVTVDAAAHRALERTIALQSIVLLRNEGAILPLSRERVRTIAVIGSNEASFRQRAGSAFRVEYAAAGKEAIELAQGSDAAIVFAGADGGFVEEITQANKRTVVVLNAGSLVTRNRLDHAAALLYVWSASSAVTDVLFGDANPSGKLPFTIPGMAEQPFGHGLSYTTFEYGDLRIYPQTPRYGQLIEVMFKLKNTGSRAGTEVVQVYIHDVKSSVERPFKELKGFKRVELGPGEMKDVMIALDQRALSFFDPVVQQWATEPGEFDVIVGSSSRDTRLKGGFELFK